MREAVSRALARSSMEPMEAFGPAEDRVKAALVGWQVGAVSRRGSARYEAYVAGTVRRRGTDELVQVCALLDMSADDLERLLLDGAAPRDVDAAGSVAFPGRAPRLRPVAGRVQWRDDPGEAVLVVERIGDHLAVEGQDGAGRIAHRFDPPVEGPVRLYASVRDGVFE